MSRFVNHNLRYNQAHEALADSKSSTIVDAGGAKIFLWYKKGSGAAVSDIKFVEGTAVPTNDWFFVDGQEECAEGDADCAHKDKEFNHGIHAGANEFSVAAIRMYHKKIKQNPIERLFEWTPCLADGGHYVFCYEAVDDGTSLQCVDNYPEATCEGDHFKTTEAACVSSCSNSKYADKAACDAQHGTSWTIRHWTAFRGDLPKKDRPDYFGYKGRSVYDHGHKQRADTKGVNDGGHLTPEVRSSSTQRCVNIQVHDDPAPVFFGDVTSPVHQAYMGGQVAINVCASDANPYDTVTISHVGDAPADELLTMPRSSGDQHEPTGHELNYRVGSTRSEEEHHVESRQTWGAKLLAGEPGNPACRMFSWVPTPYQGGWSQTVCFEATDSAGTCRVAQVTGACVKINVAKCQWQVQKEDSLVEIAPRFNTNWLQLWHLNVLTPEHSPHFDHPEGLGYTFQGHTIYVGHIYTVEYYDTVEELCNRFGTTEASIRAMNAELSSLSDIKEGHELCIIPDSCVTDKYKGTNKGRPVARMGYPIR